jgi:tetratricopeptide (TPR) repeat protein
MTLAASLAQLESAQLLFPAQDASAEFVFKHALVREAAYESLLKQERRQLHLSVGEAIEQIYAERLDEQAAILGMHFDEANDPRALDYYCRAADAAASRHANVEAIELYSRAIAVALRLNTSNEKLAQIYLRRGRQMELSGRYADALKNVTEIEAIATERNDDAMLLEVLLAFGTLRSAPSPITDVDAAQHINQRALGLAQKMNDRAAEARVYWNETLRCKFAADYPGMIEWGERAVALARELNLKELLAYALNDAYPGYLLTGDLARARASLIEARALWQELDNKPLLADTLTNIAEMQLLGGEIEQALETARESLSISTSIGNAWGQGYCQWILGEALYTMGLYSEAIRTLHASRVASRQGGFSVGEMTALCFLAQSHADLGAMDKALSFARESVEVISSVPTWKPFALSGLAYVQVALRDFDAAKQTLEEARATMKALDLAALYVNYVDTQLALEQGEYQRLFELTQSGEKILAGFGANRHQGEIVYLVGEALRRMGRYEEARQKFLTAREWIEKFQSRRALWEIWVALARCAEALGEHAEATKCREQAREEIRWVASQIDDDALREGFLRNADVRLL